MQPAGWAAVREAAARDVLAADLRCSLFASALQSYKRDSALRPFPAAYARHDCKDFEALVSALPSQPTRAALGGRATWPGDPVSKHASPPDLAFPAWPWGGFLRTRNTHPYPNIDSPKALGGCFLVLMTSDSQE